MDDTIPLSLIIDESKNGNPKMQKLLYQRFAMPMYYVCLQVSKNRFDAEDMLQEGFVRVFKNLDKYKGEGSFEGWVRKIIKRTALNFIRDNRRNQRNIEPDNNIVDESCNVFDKLAEKDILFKVKKLPAGYCIVFSMYAIEGYKHFEIAKMLGCSESNSKSQYYRSKKSLEKMLRYYPLCSA